MSVVNVEYWFFAVVPSMLRNRGHFDPHDLTHPHRRWTKADVRYVERAVRSKSHCGRQEHDRRDLFETVVRHAQDLSRKRSRKWISRGVLEDVQVTLAIEGHAQHRSHTGHDGLDVPIPRDLQNL